MSKNADLVKQWTTFYFKSISSNSAITEAGDDQECMDYLEKADGLSYSRDFASDYILVDGPDEVVFGFYCGAIFLCENVLLTCSSYFLKIRFKIPLFH